MLHRFAVRSLALSAAFLPAVAVAQAQQAATADSATAGAAASSQTKADEIVVTGSRIARTEFAAPNPIVSFNAAAIQQSGNTNITNFLQRVPALAGSLDSTQSAGANALSTNPIGAAGLNELNLRNLGANRTLVLVNGRRHVAGSPSTAAVDINSIPTDLIQSVDVLTGGASAIYGADGVSGVVNFILKRDFEGVSARSQIGISKYGDAGQRFASVIAGQNFGGGRGNITVAYEYSAEDRLQNDDRSFLRFPNRKFLSGNTADPNDDPKLPDNILYSGQRYSYESPNSAVFITNDPSTAFSSPIYDGFGRPYDNGTLADNPGPGGLRQGGEGTPVAGFYSGDLTPRIRRNDVNLLSHYDFSDAFKLSFEGKFAQTRALTFDYYNNTFLPVPIDNPYVPDAIRAAAAAQGIDSVYVSRDNIDYGRHGESDLRRTYRGVIDAAGRISDHAKYDAYYEYGRTTIRTTKMGDRINDRYQAALDTVTDPATGQPTCRSNLFPDQLVTPAVTFTPGANSGCLPVSLFGPGPISRQALAFFESDDTTRARVTQQVADASISGDFGALFSLPGGPVQFAFGGEYRRESSAFDPSVALQNGYFFSYDEPGAIAPISGHFDVKEAFGELNAPILDKVRFAETLSVGAAYRYSDYSTIGHTNTWQVNGVYAPVRDISFRGSYGKAVRAPNIGELFQPTTGTENFFTDPCQPSQINNGTQYRPANCAALVGQFDPNQLQSASNVLGTQSGNPNLKAETARTWTAGVVLRPRWIPGLTMSVDWYDIKLKGAINTPVPQQLAELCVDQPTVANQFCANVRRSPTNGQIVGYVVEPQNVAAFRTSGADLNVDYLLRTARAGTFDIRLVGGYLHRLDFVGIPGSVPIDNVDQFAGIIGQATQPSPRWNFNFSPTWTLGRVTVNYNLRWFDRTRTVSKLTTDNNPDYALYDQLRFHELWQHDLQLQYRMPQGLELYIGATNLSNQKPDESNFVNAPISAIGRFMYVGARVNLGGKS